jgi:beta-galactosidase GanA
MEKTEKNDFEIWIEIWKFWNMSRKFEMKKLIFFNF